MIADDVRGYHKDSMLRAAPRPTGLALSSRPANFVIAIRPGEDAAKAFKQATRRSGVLQELKDGHRFVPRPQRKRLKSRRARLRLRKFQKQIEQHEARRDPSGRAQTRTSASRMEVVSAA